ncbi:Zn-dependent exopeptidase [Conidiobolus coronatus NRRL 28638]|uniref:Peptide hydrolase n=1 Tax=Conidiobolus coronatus (strain ATCC 28846 / CBS 209.66 / NRRL 28638) TaxID=796925 RepID=A0A137P3J5_CONC2|nr:Zn-dependent exopeptidase [Conidiobolus coronatus NRRL 28638]|eukprot:KXN69519.1 Zn-dependent exopeptidase [Conidiobolus coronatus NRRL 28638]
MNLKNIIALSLLSIAQGDKLSHDINTLIKNTLNTDVVWDRLAEMTDTFGHRLVGSTNLEKSIDWVVDLVKSDGIDVRTENVNVTYWQRLEEKAYLVSPTRGNVTIKVGALGNSGSTPQGGVVAEVVPLHTFEQLDYLLSKDKDAIRGKIVLWNFNYTGYSSGKKFRNDGAPTALKHGALASLIRSVTPFGLNNVHVGVQNGDYSIPSAAITYEDAALLDRLYQRANNTRAINVLKKDQISFPKIFLNIQTKKEPRVSRNVIAEIKGVEKPQEYVIVSGHIDSWDLGVGALDDGAGALTSYEVLRQISKLKTKPKRTIQAIFWTSEETGGDGGDYHFQQREHEFDNITFIMESDFNTAKPDGFTFVGNDAQKAFLKKIGDKYWKHRGLPTNFYEGNPGQDILYICNQKKTPCAGYEAIIPLGNTYNNRTLANPKTELVDGYWWYHHTDADRMEAIKPDQLSLSSAYMGSFIFAAAQNDIALNKL